MTPYDEGFEDCIQALCWKVNVIVFPYPYPSKEAIEYDRGWRLCGAIHDPIYFEGTKVNNGWANGHRQWGEGQYDHWRSWEEIEKNAKG